GEEERRLSVETPGVLRLQRLELLRRARLEEELETRVVADEEHLRERAQAGEALALVLHVGDDSREGFRVDAQEARVRARVRESVGHALEEPALERALDPLRRPRRLARMQEYVPRGAHALEHRSLVLADALVVQHARVERAVVERPGSHVPGRADHAL